VSEGKWRYTYGLHQGTEMSKEMGEPKFFDTEQECLTYHAENKIWLRAIGYRVWYAYVRSPRGSEKMIESEPFRPSGSWR
jgi:hypothetical protein